MYRPDTGVKVCGDMVHVYLPSIRCWPKAACTQWQVSAKSGLLQMPVIDPKRILDWHMSEPPNDRTFEISAHRSTAVDLLHVHLRHAFAIHRQLSELLLHGQHLIAGQLNIQCAKVFGEVIDSACAGNGNDPGFLCE